MEYERVSAAVRSFKIFCYIVCIGCKSMYKNVLVFVNYIWGCCVPRNTVFPFGNRCPVKYVIDEHFLRWRKHDGAYSGNGNTPEPEFMMVALLRKSYLHSTLPMIVDKNQQ